MGERGGKSDMDRIGLFQEMGYVTISDKYKTPGVTFNAAASKGKQVLPGGAKSRSALQAGYFADKYGRIMEGEAYSDPIKIRRQYRLKEAQRNIGGKAFIPSSGEKKPSGLGNHYGTLGGPIGAFSPASKAGKQYKAPGRNFTTNPSKKGTGFGYVGITIGSYPNYQADAFERARELTKKDLQLHKNATKGGPFKLNMHPRAYFDINPYAGERPVARSRSAGGKRDEKPFKPSSPGKSPGGMKAGTFDPYPSHSADPFKVKILRPINIVNKSGKTFMPSQGPKSTPTNSIINQNVLRTLNVNNYRSISSITV